MPIQARAIEREAHAILLSAVQEYRAAQRAVLDEGGELPEVEIPLEAQLADAQAHCGRMDNLLSIIRAAIRSELRWTEMRPEMSGVYLNRDNLADPEHLWRVVAIDKAGAYRVGGDSVGPYWLGPITIAP